MYSVNVCMYMCAGMLQVAGKAGAGVAVHSKVNRANIRQGRGDITKAMGELTLFLEAVGAPQVVPHLLGTQGSRAASPQSRLEWAAVG